LETSGQITAILFQLLLENCRIPTRETYFSQNETVALDSADDTLSRYVIFHHGFMDIRRDPFFIVNETAEKFLKT
jgi:hypothetical protein